MLVCSKCGGSNIQKLAWVDVNTNKFASIDTDRKNSKWCVDCDSFTEFDIIDDEEEFYDEAFG